MSTNIAEKPSGGLDRNESSSAVRNADEKRTSPIAKQETDLRDARDEVTGAVSRNDSRDAGADVDPDADPDLADMNALYATRSWVEETPPPDGGLQAWTQVAMGWIVIFATWGYVNSFGAFQTHYTASLPNTNASAVSWIGSVQTWLTFFIGAFSGRALDAGLFLPTFAAGAALQLVGIFCMSASTRYWQLMLTQGLVTGVGGGILFTPCLALIATYFRDHRALAVGLATTGNSAGGMVYPAVAQQLLPRLGFAWTARVLGFINLAGFAAVLALMRPRLRPRKSGPIIDWSAFREPVYVAYVAAMFFFVWAVYYTLYYIASFGTEALGLSYTDATLLVTIVNGVGLPARVLTPLLADSAGPINIIAPVCLCTAAIAFCWLAVDSVPGYYAFTVVYGIASGAFQCLMPTGVASITPRLDKVGTRLGMCFSMLSIAGLTGPPLGGALQSAAGGGFTAPQAWAASSTLVCAALLFTARFLKTGWTLKAKC